jgi:hypothetical protein
MAQLNIFQLGTEFVPNSVLKLNLASISGFCAHSVMGVIQSCIRLA